jgi:dipeptidyl aminopeptidase/acylaminoacyl peptidase
MKSAALILFTVLMSATSVAEIVRYPGTANALPHDRYVRVVSETESPVQRTYIKSKDGLYVAAAIRKPKGNGPFPAIIMFHGAPGGRGLDQLVGGGGGAHRGAGGGGVVGGGVGLLVWDFISSRIIAAAT